MNIMFFQFIIAMCDLTNQVDCDYDTQTTSARNKQNYFLCAPKNQR